jgi:acyl-CoA hydrolase
MVSPPDEHGFMSLGVETLASRAACRAAKRVIAQVNQKMPRVLGDSFLHAGRVDAILEHDEALPTLESKPPTDVEQTIGRHILGLIEPGATVQMGIGGIPDAVYGSLEGQLDLGIHTEMMSDGAMHAIARGVVTGNCKTLHPGKVVITFALGSEDLYSFLDNNPLIEAHPVDHVNDPVIVSQNDNLVAVNSAISKGGKPIIALPSTAKRGAMSRIVPFLKEGAGVVTSRADVHYVVTEHGVTNLFGRNLGQRAEALIGIADPKFRDELERAAKERKLLP